MQVYEVRIPQQPASPARSVRLEAEDDGAAEALIRQDYSDLDVELWRDDQMLGRIQRAGVDPA